MSKIVNLNIDQSLYQRLEIHFKNDDKALEQFIIDAIKNQLPNLPAEPKSNENDDLESYLKKGETGSRTYGIKGQGW
jgi:hypothetical protein